MADAWRKGVGWVEGSSGSIIVILVIQARDDEGTERGERRGRIENTN